MVLVMEQHQIQRRLPEGRPLQHARSAPAPQQLHTLIGLSLIHILIRTIKDTIVSVKQIQE